MLRSAHSYPQRGWRRQPSNINIFSAASHSAPHFCSSLWRAAILALQTLAASTCCSFGAQSGSLSHSSFRERRTHAARTLALHGLCDACGLFIILFSSLACATSEKLQRTPRQAAATRDEHHGAAADACAAAIHNLQPHAGRGMSHVTQECHMSLILRAHAPSSTSRRPRLSAIELRALRLQRRVAQHQICGLLCNHHSGRVYVAVGYACST